MSTPELPKVVVIAGPNGAGKSTLAPLLLRDTFGLLEYVNADTIAQGLSAFQPEAAAFEAGRIMLKRLHHLAAKRASFAFESTLAGRAYAPWFERLRSSATYEIHVLFIWLRTPELAIQRVGERVRRGGHDVPETVIRRRYTLGIRHFFHVYRLLADTWGMYDNSGTRPVLLATGRLDEGPHVHQAEGWERFQEMTQ